MTDQPHPNRVRYNAFVSDIERDVLRLGHHVLKMVEIAVSVAREDRQELLDEVIRMEADSDRMEEAIMQRVIRTQAMESPVAHDALLLASALGVVTELEKIGDEATKLAVRVRKLGGEFPFEFTESLEDMARQAMTITSACLRLFTHYDPSLAAEIISNDDLVDKAYKNSRAKLLDRMKEDPERVRHYLRCAEIFHALEHISDHAVDIAKRLKTCYERIPDDFVA